MNRQSDAVLQRLAGRFRIAGTPVACEPLGTGHINDTYRATYEHDGVPSRYVHQKINTRVFPDPVAVMENVSRVIAHLHAKTADRGAESAPRTTLELVPASDGRTFHVDEDGEYWRTYVFVEGARTVDVAETPAEVQSAAYAYGRFQRLLADLPKPRLNETIEGFHDTPMRLEQLIEAENRDVAGRAERCRPEIEFARARAGLATALSRQVESGALPVRVTHNDTKLNNVMLDNETGDAVCVIDLDTVMPGTVLYDFGDMVRSATPTAAEDAADASAVRMDRELFEALVEGYLDATAGWLSDAEMASLALSCRVMTFECGVRFLTDFLNGDTYFKTARPGHNLDRCRSQFALLEDMERESDAMEAVIQKSLQRHRND